MTFTNSPPVFTDTAIPTINVYLGETKTQKMITTDAEGHTVTLTHSPSLSFITYDNINTYTISPISTTQFGLTTITVTATDGKMQSTNMFTVNVKSKLLFTDGTTSFKDMTIKVKSGGDFFMIPPFIDANGISVTLIIEA